MDSMAPTIGHETGDCRQPDLLAHIGGTPLLRLRRIADGLRPGVELHAKAEHLNPSGSLKDRPAKAMILAAAAGGLLTPDRAILDATSGNAGIAYAMIGAAMGYRVTLCMPADASAERKRILGIYGARIIETDPAQGSDGARRMARELALADPGRYFHVNQYDNAANWRAHYESTGPEIWGQSGGRVSHFVAGVGTSGLFMGAVAVQPDGPGHGLAGLKHMASAIAPGIYDPALADAQVTVSTAEGQAMARRLALEEGLLVGPSSGASVSAALRLARTLPEGAVVATVLFDSGARYLADSFWDA